MNGRSSIKTGKITSLTAFTAVDFNRKSIIYITELSEKLQLPLELKQEKVLKYLANDIGQYDIIFADPPYSDNAEIQSLVHTVTTGDFLKKDGIFILEHQAMTQIDATFISEKREYGQSTFSFFKFEDHNE
jgi:16S rRNA G966 N2-methylase RsmD